MPYVRYRFTTENAYLATQIIAFGSVYQVAETSVLSAELGRFGFVSCFVSTPKRAKPISKSRLSRTGHSSPINSFYRLPHQTSTMLGNGYTRFRPDSIYSGRILFIPDGFSPFRADAGHPRRFRH